MLIDMKKAALILLLLSLYFVPVFAQDEVARPETQKREMAAPPKQKKDKDPNAPSFKDRVFFGGNFWLQFWGSYRYIELSPLVGYAITPKLLGGVGLTYRYVNYESGGLEIDDNQYGYRFFGRYFIIPQLFAHAEFESLNVTSQFRADLNSRRLESQGRSWVNSGLIGGGIFQGTGRAGFFAMALYNVIPCDEIYCPYSDGWLLRVGVTAGF